MLLKDAMKDGKWASGISSSPQIDIWRKVTGERTQTKNPQIFLKPSTLCPFPLFQNIWLLAL